MYSVLTNLIDDEFFSIFVYLRMLLKVLGFV